MRTPSVIGGALLVALSGCSDAGPDLATINIELNALKHEIEYLRLQTEDLDPRVRSAEQMALQSIDEREAPLWLDCTGHRPGVLTTRVAPVTIVCEDVVRVAAGDRVRVKLGNPTSGRLDGVQLTIYAGDGAPQGRSEQRFLVKAPGPLPPGAWTTLEVPLPRTNGPSVRDLAVRAQVDAITLVQR